MQGKYAKAKALARGKIVCEKQRHRRGENCLRESKMLAQGKIAYEKRKCR